MRRSSERLARVILSTLVPLLSVLGSSVLGSRALGAATWEPRVGEPFPDLALPTLEGSAKSISDFRGQKVILHVFASW